MTTRNKETPLADIILDAVALSFLQGYGVQREKVAAWSVLEVNDL